MHIISVYVYELRNYSPIYLYIMVYFHGVYMYVILYDIYELSLWCNTHKHEANKVKTLYYFTQLCVLYKE